jgi:hypothetical protein
MSTYLEMWYYPTNNPDDPSETAFMDHTFNYKIYSQSGRRAPLFDYNKCNKLKFRFHTNSTTVDGCDLNQNKINCSLSEFWTSCREKHAPIGTYIRFTPQDNQYTDGTRELYNEHFSNFDASNKNISTFKLCEYTSNTNPPAYSYFTVENNNQTSPTWQYDLHACIAY